MTDIEWRQLEEGDVLQFGEWTATFTGEHNCIQNTLQNDFYYFETSSGYRLTAVVGTDSVLVDVNDGPVTKQMCEREDDIYDKTN